MKAIASRSFRTVGTDASFLSNKFARFFSSQSNNSSSSSNATRSGGRQFDFRVSRLGLAPRWINHQCLDSILQLSEVKVAFDILLNKTNTNFNSKASTSAVDNDLERASQVLEAMQKGGNEHLVALAIRAELQQRTGNHRGAYKTLCQFESLLDGQASNNNLTEITLAKAKILWYMGEFDKVEESCEKLLDSDQIEDFPLHYASALTGYGLAKLLQCDSLDDAFTVRDPLRMAVRHLERYPNQLGLTLIAANLNLGVSEVIYGNVVSEHRGLSVPMDPALKTWTQAMTLMETRSAGSPLEKSITAALEVRLEANLAWGVLQLEDDADDIVPLASEYAGTAIKVLDKITTVENDDKEYLRRVLTILASCYHRGGKAVTAEGLLQSATSLPKIGCTLTTLDERSAFQSCADLYKEWERRESDAERFQVKAKERNAMLPEKWQGKMDILSSLWFWTPEEFSY